MLLRRVLGDAALQGVSHVFLDEIHERNTTEDFLLIVLRDVLRLRPDLKVVLMSATVDPGVYKVLAIRLAWGPGRRCLRDA